MRGEKNVNLKIVRALQIEGKISVPLILKERIIFK